MKDHLAVSQFPKGTPITRRNFPIRNRTMALISQATVITEAREDSGVISQGWECLRLGRLLLIHESLKKLSWVREMMRYNTYTFKSVDDILNMVEEYCPEDDTAIYEKFPIEI